MLDQLRRQGRQSVVMTIRRTIFDRDGLALDEPNFAQAFPERIHQRRRLRESLMEEPDHWYRSLLGARYERPAVAAPPTSPMTPRRFNSRMESPFLLAARAALSVYRSSEGLTGRSAGPWAGP